MVIHGHPGPHPTPQPAPPQAVTARGPLAAVERLTGVDAPGQWTAYLVGLGHGGTHWIMGTIYIILPFVGRELGLSYAEIGAIFTAMNASSFVVNLAGGPIVDITGRRIVILALGLGFCALALLTIGTAPSVMGLLIGVMLIGGANNIWHPAAFSFLAGRYPNNRGFAMSVHGLGANTGEALAPVCAGTLITWLSWRDAAMINALPMFIVAAVIFIVLGRTERKTESKEKIGIDLAGYFQGMRAMVRQRAILGLCLMGGFRSMTQNGLLIFLPLYLADVIGFAPFVMGLVLAGMQVGGIISGPIAGTWSDKIGRRPIVLAGLSASTLVIVALTLIRNEAMFVGGVALLGFVLYAVRPVVHSWMMDLAPPDMSGSATSLMFGTQGLFKLVIPVAGGFIADTWGLSAVFYMLAVTMLMANLVVATLPKEH